METKKAKLKANLHNNPFDTKFYLEVDGNEFILPVTSFEISQDRESYLDLSLKCFVDGLEVLIEFEYNKELGKYFAKLKQADKLPV